MIEIQQVFIIRCFKSEHISAHRMFPGGKVLVHCVMGVNRSGAICVAYMMVDGVGQNLLQAARTAKLRRKIILTNRSFRRQLVIFERNIQSGGSSSATLLSN